MAEFEVAALPARPAKVRGAGRHGAREVALQVLYAIDLRPHDSSSREAVRSDRDPDLDLADADPNAISWSESIFDRIAENFSVPVSSVEFARELVSAVVDRFDELDALLGIHARNWRVARMAAVDRNILRMAVYELRDTDTPTAVVIDEAIDLARRFGADSSPAFVNGVLDAVAREVRMK